MAEHFDVVICGGAIMGSSVAWALTRDPAWTGRVLVVEKDPTYARSATTLSAASIRQQFSTPENIRLSRYGIEVIRDLKTLFGPEADIGFVERGYLTLASPAGVPILEANHRVQQAGGADIELLEPDAIARRWPWMSLDGIARAAYGRSGEGWFDAHMLLDLVRRAARAGGAVYAQAAVTGIDRVGDRITGVTLSDGRRIACDAFVDAAGPAAGDVARLAGLDLPVEPRKRCVFVVHCREEVPGLPMLIDGTAVASGVYVRPEGRFHICGVSPDEADDARADDDDFEVDYRLYEDVIWPALATRIPAFESLKLVRAWAGHYDFHTFDHNAVIGRHPQVTNFVFCNGFSGHGIQQGPAAGRAVAELLVHGAFRSIDLTVFGYDRLAAGRKVEELNII
ncbi:FAD-binding oxidoreductase [Siculibacillus lacustris]|uniref:FAD-binding oxidoreductase n=1 Tax=Siculibacillus lacustris TaxID=1549641 RepID=A0A4Q9VV22_9HYPH|nr:FAD-dependent oxidoreductase [Siculibacillus lacustris]TBW40081.1 FAD-binding oxidoreductase [Siculibacillus lacustris]